jgi:hypothetical protein
VNFSRCLVFDLLDTTLATAVGPALGPFGVGSCSCGTLFAAALATSSIGLILALLLRRPAAGTAARSDEEAVPRDEAAALREAGLSPAEILQSAAGR